jgi:cysteine desulfurase/selenocysteine lyase
MKRGGDPVSEPLDVARIKKDFPILERISHDHRLVYLDSANSSQKPRAVLDAMEHFAEHSYANIHRAVYEIAEESTARYEGARQAMARFIKASSTREVIFTKNATEAINLVAYSWARHNLGEGDAVLITEMEHHANIVPWLVLKEERGVELRYIPLTDDGQLDLTNIDRLIDGVRLVGVAGVSNVLGTINPVRELADKAHDAGALILVDGAQYTPHMPTDVTELGCDFYAWTGHKMLGPSGIGGLWAREELLEEMPAFLTGGEMIRDVRLDGWTPNELPWKFEAGTMPIIEAVGLGAAVEYLEGLGMDAVREHDVSMTAYALRTLTERHGDKLTIYGPAEPAARGGVISFSYEGVHPHDLSQVLDQSAVCVRAGHHCAKPLMRRLGVGATARASVYVYNDEADVDALNEALGEADRLFAI